MKRKVPEKQPLNSHRQPPNPKGQGLTKRKGHSHNKQNFIQITEPLDANPQSFSSKEFILSRQNFNHNSKAALRQGNVSSNKKNQGMPAGHKWQQNQGSGQQQWVDRRLSLKCAGNYSQQLDNQKSHRLSMMPLRRDSIGQMTAVNNWMDQRESTSSFYQNSWCGGDSKKKVPRKQAIITNLMHKLDHQQDLRSIIESKLKTGASSSNLSNMKEKRNQSYITDYTQQPHNQALGVKMRQCQNQIGYFKGIIRQMSQKITELTEEKKFRKRGFCQQSDQKNQNSKMNFDSDIRSLPRKNRGQSPRCQCQAKQSRTIAIQTENVPVRESHQSFDFLDNLQKTLKVLDGNS